MWLKNTIKKLSIENFQVLNLPIINLNTNNKKPRFVKNYFDFNEIASNIVKEYNQEVKLKKFPSNKFTYN